MKIMNSPTYQRQLTLELCPHHLGHYLGMDVHDVDEMSRSSPLFPDTLVTIEPGQYVFVCALRQMMYAYVVW